jgi:hypothetical protein
MSAGGVAPAAPSAGAFGVDNQTGILTDVLPGRPDHFRWVPLNSISAVTFANMERSGHRFDHERALAQHQAYGPRVGVPRLLEQLRRTGIRATFFVPGFTADCYPDTIRRIVADGHEVGWHGYRYDSSLRDDDVPYLLGSGAGALLQVLTMHPFLSGRPARSRTIGRFVEFARELGGVWFATAREVADHARSALDESGARRLRSALDPAYGMRDPDAAGSSA